MKKILLDKIKSREAVIGIIGLGYVGLPLMLRFCESGYRVLGFDIDQDKIKKLNAGESYIQHISSANISMKLSHDTNLKFSFESKFSIKFITIVFLILTNSFVTFFILSDKSIILPL